MINDSETDCVYVSSLIRERHRKVFNGLAAILEKEGLEFGLLTGTKDIWCRDYMPLQIGRNRFLQYKFFPDYLDNSQDAHSRTIPEEVWKDMCLNIRETSVVLDGGNIVKCGEKVVMTDKPLKVGNHGYSPAELTRKLEELFECEIVWLPWDKVEIFGHSDGIVKYIGNGTVLLTNYSDFNKHFGREFEKVLTKHFTVVPLRYFSHPRGRNSWAYINFLQTKNTIIIPALGEAEDGEAYNQISNAILSASPHYEGHIHQLHMAEIVQEGGALNCITWNIQTPWPRVAELKKSIIVKLKEARIELEEKAKEVGLPVGLLPGLENHLRIIENAVHPSVISSLSNLPSEYLNSGLKALLSSSPKGPENP